MKQKVMIISIGLLVISLFSNLVLSLNLKEEVNKKNNIIKEFEQIQEKQEKQKELLQGSDTKLDYVNGEEVERIIETFFRTQYDYDNENYKERFTKIKPFVSNDVYGQLTSAGIPDVPSIKFSNVVNDIQIYITEKTDHMDSLILLDTTYSIEGFDNSVMTQIFNVKFNNGVITSLELIGTFTKMSES